MTSSSLPTTRWLDLVLANVRKHPLAATALAVHLRRTPHATVDEGLAAESAVYSLLQAGPEFAAWLRSRAMPTVAPDVEPPVLVTRDGDVLTITLNRPGRHNAVNERLRAVLADALTVGVARPPLSVDLHGAGPSFSSGGDLAEFGSSVTPRRPTSAGSRGAQVDSSASSAIASPSTSTERAWARASRWRRSPDGSSPTSGRDLAPGDRHRPDPGGRWHRQPAEADRPPPHGAACAHRRTISATTALEWGLVDEMR